MTAPSLAPETLKDLERSGLTDETIEASQIRDGSTDEEVAALLRDRYKVKGYVLPYFGLDLAPLNRFYRIKVISSLNGHEPPKYLQPKAAGNHLYLPPLLGSNPKWFKDTKLPLVITEGEKKALAAAQIGLPTVAVAGVFSWRTHIHSFDRGVVRVEDKPSAKVVHLDDRGEKTYRSEVAPEFEKIEWGNREVFIVFDDDAETNPEVQRASFELANWLADHGAVPRQISLANRVTDRDVRRAGRNPGQKLGLDDLLAIAPAFGEDLLDPEWRSSNSFRPLPQDPLAWTTEQLNSGRATRDIQERVARFAIDWLDANGTRFMGVDGTYYFFDAETRVLHDFHVGSNLGALRETSFGHLLVEQLGLDPADNSTVGRLIGRYPLGAAVISPHRVIGQTPSEPDVLYYQASDADMVKITAGGLSILSNGDDDVLFYKGAVEPLDLDALSDAAEDWRKPGEPLWYKALSTLNIEPMGELTHEATLQLLTCLFYISPWLNRWRGLMLPLEIAVAEAGSGKSFTYNLRMGVLTGRPSLSGLPNDYRDWVAAVGTAPSLWVCDNLGNVKSDFWHRLNDELARLITDPAPAIELRQLYTTATAMRVPVNSAFAITTIKNPFTAPDVLQRALIYNLSAIPAGKRDPDWYTDRLARRIEWVAEHLNVLHLFLRQVEKKWRPNFKSGYRLVHFEQAILIVGSVLGWDMSDTVSKLAGVVAAAVAQYDPIIEALATFVEEWPSTRRRKVGLRDVTDWAEVDPGERFVALRQLGNEILLAKYVLSHKYDIEQALGVEVIRDGSSIFFMLPGGNK